MPVTFFEIYSDVKVSNTKSDSIITVKSFCFHKSRKVKTRILQNILFRFSRYFACMSENTENRFVIHLDDTHQRVYSAYWTHI